MPFSPRRTISRMGRTMSVTDRYFKAWLIKFFYANSLVLKPYRDINTKREYVKYVRSYWIHVALSRSVENGTLSYYVNDVLIHEERFVSRRAIPGNGTLRLGHSRLEGAKWFNGLISQLNIYGRALYSPAEIRERVQGQHCCRDNLPNGNWLNWDQATKFWTLHGTARFDKGADCTSFQSTQTFVLYWEFRKFFIIWRA